jgi:hypothetical protein
MMGGNRTSLMKTTSVFSNARRIEVSNTAPRRTGDYPARGTQRDRGNYRCEGRRVPQSWRLLNHAELCQGEQLALFVGARRRSPIRLEQRLKLTERT